MADILGDAGSGLLFGCVSEDLTAQRFETTPHNLADDYLKHIKNMEARRCNASGEPAYDFGWVWQELGLAARRQ